jgi:hypothetical protein
MNVGLEWSGLWECFGRRSWGRRRVLRVLSEIEARGFWGGGLGGLGSVEILQGACGLDVLRWAGLCLPFDSDVAAFTLCMHPIRQTSFAG